jgi:glyoxylase-like metal-dependent hydrolase (beta-lactamase superfamily II)
MYQSMFLVYDRGVVVIDAPPSSAKHIPEAIAEVTPLPITHVIYSHSHIDHIGGTHSLPGRPIIIRSVKPSGFTQQEEIATLRLLVAEQESAESPQRGRLSMLRRDIKTALFTLNVRRGRFRLW